MKNPIVIAHRGACGYLPEHTLEGVALAHAMDADYIELDVVLTRDNVLIVLHDLVLDAMTDVAGRFPGRQREDGFSYAIDFTLEEIKSLRVHERLKADGQPEFPGRFPPGEANFRIPTMAEELALIQGLNRSRCKDVGIYVEPKSPEWHASEGRSIIEEVIRMLAHFGYRRRDDKAILQSFDFEQLKNARHTLKTDLKLVQLIGENSWQESKSDFDYLRTAEGLSEIAAFADGIGPWLMQLVTLGEDGSIIESGLVTLAHRAGLFVHGYTLRADQLPAEIGDMAVAVELLSDRLSIDGVFTDHPDQVIRCRNG